MTAWQESTPPPPDSVREWMERFGGEGLDGDAASLTRGALRALREALARPGRDREAAYALLAADGLLTYAVEALLERSDPDAALTELMDRVAAEHGAQNG